MLKSLFTLGAVAVLVAGACTAPGARNSARLDLKTPNAWPKMLAVYMPWFGDRVHMDVGYSSNDPGVLKKQIQQARHMGISAFVVDWYGESNAYSDHNYALMQAAADEAHFQVALLYNEAEDDDGRATESAIAAMDKAYKDYIGPQAAHRGAYLMLNGHPMIFIFPKSGHLDWNRVYEHCRAWEASPVFFYKDQPAEQFAGSFAGSFAWVQPGAQGWSRDGSNWGEQYLDDFYKTMKNKHPDKVVVGAAWPGFDDSAAKWGLNRHMDRQCGQTLDNTLHLYGRYFDQTHPLPFLMIETWNDYEEGTAVERPAEQNCAPQRN